LGPGGGGVGPGGVMAGGIAGAATGVAASGPGVRPPGSGHRGRTPGPSLGEGALRLLAEYLLGCADKNLEKVVEGFQATFPPGGPKPPAKTRVREAVKRLGAWSAASRRWALHGGGVEEAVAGAIAAAAAAASAAAATQLVGTPLSGLAAVASQGVMGSAVAAAGAQHLPPGAVMTPLQQGGGAGGAVTPTPTPGGPGAAQGLPAPTPTPQLGLPPSRLVTPCAAAGALPALHAPACTPAENGTAVRQQRPTGHHMLPQHLAAALAKLANDAPPAPSPMPSGTTSHLPGPGALGAAGPGAPACTPVGVGGGGMVGAFGGARARAPTPSSAAVLPLDGSLLQRKLLAAAELQTAVEAVQEEAEEEPLVVASRPAAGAEGKAAAALAGAEEGEDAMECEEPRSGGPLDGLPGGASRSEADGSAGDAAGPRPEEEEDAGGEQGGRMGAMERGEEGAPPPPLPLVLPKPMPPAPPALPELAALGTAHPHWRLLTGWLLGGGGAAARARRHGPSWADVSAALQVFEAGELEPRLGAVPLDVVRALLAVCHHRRSSHLRSGAFKALGNLAAALGAAAAQPATAGAGAGTAGSSPGRPARRRGPGRANKTTPAAADTATEPSPLVLRPTGQPSRCSPQPVTLPALLALPGLLEALRVGCCRSDPDSEVDKAARAGARVLAALVGVGILPLSATAPFGASQQQQQQEQEQQQQGDGAENAGPAVQSPLSREVADAAAAFRLKVASNPDLHSALRDAACPPAAAASDPPTSARAVYRAHMLLALQRVLRDPAAAPLVTKTKERVAKERDAAASGRPPPAPASADVQSKCAARLLQRLVAGGAEVEHPGCRKGLVQCAVALLEHPHLRHVLVPQPPEAQAADGSGAAGGQAGPALRDGWGALLGGNDPRTQLPATCLTLLASELRHISASCVGAEETALDKCARSRVLFAVAVAERALLFLARNDATAKQLLKHADTRTAVADMLQAIQKASSVLAGNQDPSLESLIARVEVLATDLA
ncbi:hypothetical protein Agub_g9910, partial [Astrephomene gubernaculifera]